MAVTHANISLSDNTRGERQYEARIGITLLPAHDSRQIPVRANDICSN